MIENATGIILRVRPLTETSLIVHWLTSTVGRLATVAKGARRPRSPFAGKLDLFFEGDFSFHRSRRSELHPLREVTLRESHSRLRRELGCLQQASYAAALIEQTTETETPVPEIYTLFVRFVWRLDAHVLKPRHVFAFELKLLRLLGLEPNLSSGRLAPATRDLVQTLLETDEEALDSLPATAPQVRALRQFLHGFLIFHLGRIPPGRNRALGESP